MKRTPQYTHSKYMIALLAQLHSRLYMIYSPSDVSPLLQPLPRSSTLIAIAHALVPILSPFRLAGKLRFSPNLCLCCLVLHNLRVNLRIREQNDLVNVREA